MVCSESSRKGLFGDVWVVWEVSGHQQKLFSRHPRPHCGHLCPPPWFGRISGYVAQIAIPRAPSPGTTPPFLWFPHLVLSSLGPRSTHAFMHVLAYTLWNAHVGNLKMSEEFCLTPFPSPLPRFPLLRPGSPAFWLHTSEWPGRTP